MNRQYATNLVNTIEVDFISNLILSREALVEYDYEVTGLIKGIYSADSSRKETELWTKSYTLVDRKQKTVSKKSNRISEKLEIDFEYFNNIVVDFKRELKLNIDATFTVTMLINYTILAKEEEVTKTEELVLTFPLNKAAFVINTTVPEAKEETITTTYDGEVYINYPFLVAAIIFLIIALILLVKFIIRIRILTMKTEYQKSLNKILKTYGDIIVESKTFIDIVKYQILEVHDFDDLVDIENEVRIPIIYYNKKPDIEGWFILVHGNLLYRYILHGKHSIPKYEHKH